MTTSTSPDDTNSRTGLIGIGPIPSLAPVAAFNVDQIENLLKTKGILAWHVRHALDFNRANLTAGLDVSRTGSENPFLFYDIRPFLVVPQHFTLNDTLSVMGLNGTGTTAMNVTGEYLDGTGRVFLRPQDIILLNPTITDLHEELFEFDGSTEIQLQYPVRSVDYFACASVGRMEQETDFGVVDGKISLLSGAKAPTIGEVCSVVYEYSPIYIVNAVPHVLRLLPSNEQGHGSQPRKLRYGPQFILATRSTTRDTSINWNNVLEGLEWRKWLNQL